MENQKALDVHNASQVERFLARPQVRELLAGWIEGTHRVELLSDAPERGVVYKIDSDRGTCVVRFPLDARKEAALKREARATKELHPLVRIDIPETTFFSSENGRPALAIHRWIDGVPLTTEMYDGMSDESRHDLAHDLAEFLVTVHAVDLAEAATWCGVGSLEHLPPGYGKPQWFDEDLRARTPKALHPQLEPGLITVVTETIREFEELVVSREELVFGHGDIHGFNLAMRPTAKGYGLGGIFDFEIAGIQDTHEDFFRLYFISSDLVDRTVGAYEGKREHEAPLDRARIHLYWRAFLIYLMMEHLEMDNFDLFQLYKKLLVETVSDKER